MTFIDPEQIRKTKIGPFVARLFYLGNEPKKPEGVLASFRGNATEEEISSFAETPEVFQVANRFLNEIYELWKKANGGEARTDDSAALCRLAGVPALADNSQAPGTSTGSSVDDYGDFMPKPAVGALGLPPPARRLPLPLFSVPVKPVEVVEPPPVSASVAPTHNAGRVSGSAPTTPAAKPGQIPAAGATAGKPVPPMATFRVPNAKVGISFVGKIEGKDQTGVVVRIRNPILPMDLGLTFDEASSELRGTPQADGEQRISLQWSSDGSSWFTGECMLFINADPRSLWKNIEPPADDPYFKPNTDSALIKASSYSIVAASRRGRSHEHAGTFRDDDFFVAHVPNANWSVIIVADGAGGAKSSRQGAKIAVKVFGVHLQEQLAGDLGRKLASELAGWTANPQVAGQSMGADFHYLFHKAGSLAVQAIEVEAQGKGAAVKDYSTTLLAAVARWDADGVFLSTFWMGDGAIAAYGPRGKVRLMGVPDSGDFAGQTRFLDRAALADAGFAKRVGIGRYSDITALMVMTDGVSDPRFETDVGLADAALWDQLWDEVLPLLKSDNPTHALVDWLHFFSPGHHDDRTIAIAIPV